LDAYRPCKGSFFHAVSQQAALRRLASGDGLVLDLTYTAKAMAGLIARTEADASIRDCPAVFLDTGGTPELFTRPANEIFGSAPGHGV